MKHAPVSFLDDQERLGGRPLSPTPAERVSAPDRGLVYQRSAIIDDPDGDQGFLALRVNGFLKDQHLGLEIIDRLRHLGPVDPPARYQVIVTVVRLGAIE